MEELQARLNQEQLQPDRARRPLAARPVQQARLPVREDQRVTNVHRARRGRTHEHSGEIVQPEEQGWARRLDLEVGDLVAVGSSALAVTRFPKGLLYNGYAGPQTGGYATRPGW